MWPKSTSVIKYNDVKIFPWTAPPRYGYNKTKSWPIKSAWSQRIAMKTYLHFMIGTCILLWWRLIKSLQLPCVSYHDELSTDMHAVACGAGKPPLVLTCPNSKVHFVILWLNDGEFCESENQTTQWWHKKIWFQT